MFLGEDQSNNTFIEFYAKGLINLITYDSLGFCFAKSTDTHPCL